MFYIFNSNNICVSLCDIEPDIEDLHTRGEFSIQSDESYRLGSVYNGSEIENFTVIVDYPSRARSLRDSLRSSIDKFLLPSSTILDVLVTGEQKNILIQDSLLLAQWPMQEGWPYISLPVLSELCVSLITIPDWVYTDQTTV